MKIPPVGVVFFISLFARFTPFLRELFFARSLPVECVKLCQNRAKTLVFAYIIECLPFIKEAFYCQPNRKIFSHHNREKLKVFHTVVDK